MRVKKAFRMPKRVGITGRTSTITNSFVHGIIPVVFPSDREIDEALKILNLGADDLRCVYCGGHATEWEHLRPIVADKKPTGYFSEISNLVPSCGKCNQSKGGRYWKDWICSDAELSPARRKVPGLKQKIKRLERYERWGRISPCNFKNHVNRKLWKQYWSMCEDLHLRMKKAQVLADQIRKTINISAK